MNPPPALYGAMSKERKPFTYTPGGLDLSEIKSERMAKRLMRNAMSEGVSELPVQNVHSPPAPVTPSAMPNFNCLPVQVFPQFQLPANPKSLLRTRSNPNQIKEPASNLICTPKANTSDDKSKLTTFLNKNRNADNNENNTKLGSMYDYTPLNSSTICQPAYYGSQGHTEILQTEKFYDGEECQTEPNKEITLMENIAVSKDKATFKSTFDEPSSNTLLETINDFKTIPVTLISPYQDPVTTNNTEQKEVKVITKQSGSQYGTDQNGDAEAAVVIKLPAKTSSAKTETKVEISKKVLPDGTVEEIKKTITKTTKDGKTEITTQTETRTIPKEVIKDDEDEVVEEEVEEEEVEEAEIGDIIDEEEVKLEKKEVITEENVVRENGEVIDKQEEVDDKNSKTDSKQNGHIITGEEKVEKSTTKKVVVVQSTQDEPEEEIEEDAEDQEEDSPDVEVEQVVILRKSASKPSEELEESDVETSNDVEETNNLNQEKEPAVEAGEIENRDDSEGEEDVKIESKEKIESHNVDEDEKEEKEEQDQENIEDETKELVEEYVEEEYEEAEDAEIKEELSDETADTLKNENVKDDSKSDENNVEQQKNNDKEVEPHNDESLQCTDKKSEIEEKQNKEEIIHEIKVQAEPKVSFREPSIPLEKVEDIEIKPIVPAQEIIKKSHTEIITTTTDKPAGALSTQTEYKQIENIVTVNRTTKTLDHAYEQTQQSLPTLKTYFTSNDERNLSTPQPVSRPYQPVYPPEPSTERRHSLLLDRLSVERQISAPDPYQSNYQYTNQGYEPNQWEEPQSEVVTVSNVKPSTITKNQQWYQQINRENTSYNPSPAPLPSQQLGQTYIQPQPKIQIQQPEPQYQSYMQPQYTPKPEFKPYVESNVQNIYKSGLQQNTYTNYSSKPSWVSNTYEPKPASLDINASAQSNNYYSLKKESTESYQDSTQLSSSYVPPPWEQDSSYISENQNYYQPATSSVPFTPSTNKTWKPKPASKFSKNHPTSYIPPAPNQSFVKPVAASDITKLPGRKTYYSEYERRYISVPESTYIPSETKFQAQPDPSPQYYYDNNEPVEIVEPQWRKELREFTEKTSEIGARHEKTSVRPPWEEDPKYATPSTEYTATVTPSWTQTLRPRTWRERSYEPEYIGSKSSTLGRGRPQSSYVKGNVDTIPERPRGVSVDRYNPNSYQSPVASEHPPVQSQTLNHVIHPKAYHNPNVPAYHSRASAEPREQACLPQVRPRVETRAPPVQSRSFKYLQWITGTED